ncbi:MAG: hypothetical protein CMC65_05750 [Flavobacteriaceae bacterium]|nr:hypothetical protein [Flavobacteriaceae bacterium]|tara:strand:- start:97 stop:552 length:456 start_codon:yes stop_codon:yes gene_type:complete
MKFKKLSGAPQFELAPYVKKYLEDHKYYNVKMYMGCDSQTRNGKTTYATTLVFHVSSTGCHVIYKKEVLHEIKDMWTRLWMECEKSVEVALYLREHGIEIDTIDLDYNIDPAKKSNKLVKAAVGYVNGFGFKARYKPDLLPGVYAADNIAN